MTQDLEGNLSVVSSRESRQSEKILLPQLSGQFQAQMSDSTSKTSIAHYRTVTPSQSEIFSNADYDANCESSSRETSRPSSGNLTTRTLYSPLPEMAIVHHAIHDAIDLCSQRSAGHGSDKEVTSTTEDTSSQQASV